jgi:hypothetical protein
MQNVPFSRPNRVSSTALASRWGLVWSLAFPVLALPEKALMAPRAATPLSPTLPDFAVCTARAFPMMGQRRAMVCKLDMLPPPGEACRAEVEVERERSVAGEVFFRNGHIAFDWRSTASMAGGLGRSAVGGVVVYYFVLEGGFFVVFDRLQKMGGGRFMSSTSDSVGTCGALSASCLAQQDPKHNFQWEQADWSIWG